MPEGGLPNWQEPLTRLCDAGAGEEFVHWRKALVTHRAQERDRVWRIPPGAPFDRPHPGTPREFHGFAVGSSCA